MTIQIAVRLPEDLVSQLDKTVLEDAAVRRAKLAAVAVLQQAPLEDNRFVWSGTRVGSLAVEVRRRTAQER